MLVPSGLQGAGVQIFSMQGRLLAYRALQGGVRYQLQDLFPAPGMYVVGLRHEGGYLATTRWIRN